MNVLIVLNIKKRIDPEFRIFVIYSMYCPVDESDCFNFKLLLNSDLRFDVFS